MRESVFAIGAGEHLEWVKGFCAGVLFDVKGGQRTIGGPDVGVGVFHAFEGAFAGDDGLLIVFDFHRPGAVVARAFVDEEDTCSGNEAHEVARREADVLRLEVTGNVIGDRSRSGTKILSELAFAVES